MPPARAPGAFTSFPVHCFTRSFTPSLVPRNLLSVIECQEQKTHHCEEDMSCQDAILGGALDLQTYSARPFFEWTQES